MSELKERFVCFNHNCNRRRNCDRYNTAPSTALANRKADPETCGQGWMVGRSHTWRLLYGYHG